MTRTSISESRSLRPILIGVFGCIFLFEISVLLRDRPKEYNTREAALRIAKQHLFGQWVPTPTQPPLTTLGLHLQGIAWSTQAATPSRAIIAGPDGTAKIYGVGDALPSQGVIKVIDKEEVFFIQNGQMQRLKLPSYKGP